jgi:hypothetical protein
LIDEFFINISIVFLKEIQSLLKSKMILLFLDNLIFKSYHFLIRLFFILLYPLHLMQFLIFDSFAILYIKFELYLFNLMIDGDILVLYLLIAQDKLPQRNLLILNLTLLHHLPDHLRSIVTLPLNLLHQTDHNHTHR